MPLCLFCRSLVHSWLRISVRLDKVTYPDGREINYDYGTTGAIDDIMSRLARRTARTPNNCVSPATRQAVDTIAYGTCKRVAKTAVIRLFRPGTVLPAHTRPVSTPSRVENRPGS